MYWHPLGGETGRGRPWRPGSREDHRKAGYAEPPPHEETARMIRAALRPGA